jgi:sulfur-carrier protein adenylyltransferase/sulfurtransferase
MAYLPVLIIAPLEESAKMEEITALDLKRRLDAGDDLQIVDVREANEVAFCRLPDTVHIPLGEVVKRLGEIDPSRETIVHCKGGVRSARAITALQQAGFTGKLVNLTGGITAWSNDVDPGVPKY